MLDAQPLPNDLLRSPPWQETINTWPINESFLTALKVVEEELGKSGYYLKFGVEINLGILTPDEAKGEKPKIGWRLACQEQFAKDLSQMGTDESFSSAAERAYVQLEDIAEQHRKKLDTENTEWLKNWEKTQEFYEQTKIESDAKALALAKKNFMIAVIHLLPPHLGGVNGLIEQRFSSEHYGYGWWDEGVLELRTIPTRGAERTIEEYHHILWRLQSAVKYFDFVPVAANAYAQVHFSLWRASDDVNIMADDSEESLAIREKLGDAFYKVFNEAPLGRFSKIAAFASITDAPFVGSSRVSTVRTHLNSWELRGQGCSGVTHLARDMFIIATAVGQTLGSPQEECETFARFNQQQRALKADITGKNPEEREHDEHKTRRVRRLSIASDIPRTACPFISCLEGAILDDEGRVIVSELTIQWNGTLLMKAIGDEDGYDLFSVSKKGEVFNLYYATTWAMLFKKIRVTEDGILDTTQIPTALAHHFEGLSVASVLHDVHMPEVRPTVTRSEKSCQDAMTSRCLAQGLISMGDVAPLSEALQRAHQEIFGFVVHRETVFDPEEARAYLDGLQRRFKSNPKRVQSALFHYLNNTLYNPLLNLALYNSSPEMQRAGPFIEKYETLKYALSSRESLLAALQSFPEPSPLLDRFRAFLNGPEKLYSFANIERFIRNQNAAVRRHVLKLDKEKSEEFFEGMTDEKLKEKSDAFGELGEALAIDMLQVAAAAQNDEASEQRILQQYKRLAAVISAPDVRLPEAEHPAKIKFLAVLGQTACGAKAGFIAEADRLLADRAPIEALRQRALADLSVPFQI